MQEQFSYSLMASGLGILIVFLILVFLSILMIVIRKIFDDAAPGKQKKSVKSAKSEKAYSTGVKSKAPQLPLPVLVAAAVAEGTSASADAGFIAAAVAAYFASEEDSSTITAKSWVSIPGAYDPWVANNKLSKTVPGV